MGMSGYRSPCWLPGGHLQTLYPYFFAPRPKINYRRERWELPDGDFLDMDWLDGPVNSDLVVLFHGLEGNARGYYILTLMQYIQHAGFTGVVVNFRGCSGEANRLQRAYFAGDSAEIDYIINRLHNTSQFKRIFSVGFSLGGNALLLWLGQQGQLAKNRIQGVVSVSAPLNLTAASNTLDNGINRILYTRYFLYTLKKKAVAKLCRHPHRLNIDAIKRSTTLREFDDYYTAPVHGYRDALHYWQQAASLPVLQHISVPTLLINARNDPFLPGHFLPEPQHVSRYITLEFPDTGGHVGFPVGTFPGRINWLPSRIIEYFMTIPQTTPDALV